MLAPSKALDSEQSMSVLSQALVSGSYMSVLSQALVSGSSKDLDSGSKAHPCQYMYFLKI